MREAEKSLFGDVLIARHTVRDAASINRHEQKQVVDSPVGLHRFPHELRTHRGFPFIEHSRVTKVRVNARREIVHAMDEQHEVDVRRPIDRVPRRARKAATDRACASNVRGGARRADRRERAAALEDDVPGVRPVRESGSGIRDANRFRLRRSRIRGRWSRIARCRGALRR